MSKVTVAIRRDKDITKVELDSFSKLAVLAHAGIPESRLIENDPEDEDTAVDCFVTHRDGWTVVSILAHNESELFYTGKSADWE